MYKHKAVNLLKWCSLLFMYHRVIIQILSIVDVCSCVVISKLSKGILKVIWCHLALSVFEWFSFVASVWNLKFTSKYSWFSIIQKCVVFSVIYASNYDHVSRPCSSTAAGFQPEVGHQPFGQCRELLIPWRRSSGSYALFIYYSLYKLHKAMV